MINVIYLYFIEKDVKRIQENNAKLSKINNDIITNKNEAKKKNIKSTQDFKDLRNNLSYIIEKTQTNEINKAQKSIKDKEKEFEETYGDKTVRCECKFCKEGKNTKAILECNCTVCYDSAVRFCSYFFSLKKKYGQKLYCQGHNKNTDISIFPFNFKKQLYCHAGVITTSEIKSQRFKLFRGKNS